MRHAPEDFLALLSHDLRNPLSAIVLSAGHLLKHLPGESPENGRLHQRADLILGAAARITHLLDDLMDAAGLESGEAKLELGTHSAAALIDEAVRAVTPLAAAKELRVLAPNLAPDVSLRCDGARIVRLLSMLLANAVRIAPRQGIIALKAGVGDGAIHFGVAPANLASGGLWRHVSDAIVEAHGGNGWSEEALQGEATFCFSLPLN